MLTFNGDHFVMASYQFGDMENNGEEYQKAAFEFAKSVEKNLAGEYDAAEYYNGDLNELTEEAFKSNEEASKMWNREYIVKDKFDTLSFFKETAPDRGYDELKVGVSLEKIQTADGKKIARVNLYLTSGEKVNPQ